MHQTSTDHFSVKSDWSSSIIPQSIVSRNDTAVTHFGSVTEDWDEVC